MILESFIKECLDDPTRVNQKYIDVTGRLKDRSNKIESFCVRPYDLKDNTFSQSLSSKSNADKMVFAFNEYWIILDVNEIKKFSKLNNKRKLMFEDLYNNTDWITKIKRHDIK
mgnify:FL=1|jgi:hypothetical protein|tara:strand:- start:395 stop:733 length:339 start_codon:yes stop_codon:yes gene_type:complete